MLNQIRNILLEGVNNEAFPGATFCLVSSSGKIQCDAVGYKMIHPVQTKNDVNTIYDVASLTKVVSTTTMIMKLIEANKLSLDSNVQTFLPRFKHPNITIYHLLCHISGLPADIKAPRTLQNKDDVMKRIYDMDLEYKPATYVVYSDIGFILLGEVIQKIVKRPLSEYANDIIFTPLLMTDTAYHPKRLNVAPTEFRDDTYYKGLLQGKVHDEKSFALNGESGHAGLFTKVYDLALFIRAILNETFVLKKETLNELFKLQVNLPDLNGTKQNRALGWDKPTYGSMASDNVSYDETIMHTGFTGCHMIIERQQKTGIIVLSNGVHPKRENNQMPKYRKRISKLFFNKKEGKENEKN